MANLLAIAISGLRINQSALATTGHNISNANTEGYTRQRVEAEANAPYRVGVGYLGTGAHVSAISRIANEFLVQQLRADTSMHSQLDAYSTKLEQLDNYLGDSSTGLSSAMNDFFASLQSASDSPASIPSRQLVLSNCDVLAQRFNGVYAKMDEINSFVNSEMDSNVKQINTLAVSIAEINDTIALTQGSTAGGIPANDLLDKRDQLLRDLSGYVNITTAEQKDGRTNVFIGKGQPLVIGNVVSRLQVINGDAGSARKEIAYVGKNGMPPLQVSRDITGGKLGGLLDFRNNVLDKSFNEVGRLTLALSDAMNRQQASGLDLRGNYGGLLFSDINERQMTLDRVVAASTNAQPDDRVVSVNIDDTSKLSDSEYRLELSGQGAGSYSLVRLSDNTEVAAGAFSSRPAVIEADGFSITLESGTFQNGDAFRIVPSRFAARDFALEATRPEALAFAAPVTTSNDLGNTGTGKVTQAQMLQVIGSDGARLSSFADPGKLSPPLIVRFTSPTTYDILDNSDPAHPKALTPPLTNLMFVPGRMNNILATEPGQTTVASNGFNAGRIANNVVTIPPGPQPANAFQAETLSITYTDPVTGMSAVPATLGIAAGTSARDIAATLSSLQGVSASASTYMALQLQDDAAGQRLEVTLNGVDLTAPVSGTTGLVYPPVPLTTDYLADAINNSTLAANGVRAVSDGITLRIYSSRGDDFQLQVGGDATDAVLVKGDKPASLQSTVSIANGVNFNAGAPTSFTLDIGTGPRTIQLAGVFNDQASAVAYIQQQIDTTFNSPSKVVVQAQPDGTLSFSTFDNAHTATIAIAAVTNDVLGLTSAAAEGAVVPTDIVAVAGAGALPAHNALTVGGELSVTLQAGYALTSSAFGMGNIFTSQPPAASNYFGYAFSINGYPDAGDTFSANFNSNGVSDNRNLVDAIALQRKNLISGTQSFGSAYAQTVSRVGTETSQAMVNLDASASVMQQTEELRNTVSGVNLDEEAADLVKFQMAYNASSKVISVAREMFDTLINAFS